MRLGRIDEACFIASTKANISVSGGLSRQGLDQARVELPLEALTTRAKKIIGDLEFAASKGFSDMPEVCRVHDFLQTRDR